MIWIIGFAVTLGISGCGDAPAAASVTANAGADKTVHVGSRVQLDATGSVTESDWVYHFKWSVVSKPSGSAVALNSTTATAPSFTADKVGEYVFDLNVTADEIGSAIDQVKITATNIAPIANGISLILDVNRSNTGINWRSASSASDADGDTLSASVAANGTYGTCTVVGDQFTYLKTTETTEVDHCTLRVSDGYTTVDVVVNIEALYWKKIASKVDFTLAIKSDGTLWGWGANLHGQLGDDTTLDRDHPVQEATHATDWVDVAVGAYHSLSIKSDGSLYAWGSNKYGQVGDGANDDRHKPTLIDSNHSWLKVTAGYRYSVALRSDHTLWSWGENYNGKTLGIGVGGHHNTPVQVGGATATNDWADVSAGRLHTLAIKTDGTLYAWGIQYSSDGRLGDGTGASQSVPVQVGTASNWSSVSAASYDSFAINEDGDLYAWGRNSSGVLGVGDHSKRTTPTQVGSSTWKEVSGGANHAMGIRRDGSLWGWGENGHAQRGDTYPYSKTTPVQIGSDTDWESISAATTTTSALKTNGVAYGWGYNKFGQLGNKKTDTLYVPTQILQEGGHTWKKISVGLSHVLAIRDDKTLWAWGSNSSGELGNNQINSSYTYTPVQEHNGFTDWMDVRAGNFFSVALRENNTLWTWGTNRYGKLGLGSDFPALSSKKIPTQVGTNHWVKICTGANHAAAIRKDSFKLYLWGNNANGQLGAGDYVDRNAPTQDASSLSWESVSCGQSHTMAIKKGTSATLYGWGYNGYGQLGINNTDTKHTPTIVSDGWQSVAAGKNHTIGIKTSGALYGWGHNNVGQLGVGYPQDRPIPNLLSVEVWGMVAAGGDTSMAIKGDDTVWAWGDNIHAQHAKEGREIPFATSPQEIASLSGTQSSFFTDMSVSDKMVGLVRHDSNLWVWGANDYKQLSRDWYTKEPTVSIERH